MSIKKKLGSIVISLAMISIFSCVNLDAGAVQKNSERELALIDKLHEIADPSLSPEQRADLVISKMSLEDRIRIIGGYQRFYIKGFAEYGLRDVEMADATMGLRNHGRVTAFPMAIVMASTWNRDLIFQTGNTVAKECRAKGVDVLLGPGVNIYRVPNNGRNYEYFGEDPYLAAQLSGEYIKGIQDLGIMAVVKHFVADNSDFDRHRMSSDVDERTLNEIYYPAFKNAVQNAGVKSVMTAYNPVNGVSASENTQIIGTLNNKWGFKGIVMADWESVYNAYEPFVAGLDLEMPGPRFFNAKNLIPLLEEGKITEEQLNNKVKRILSTCFSLGIYDRPAVDSNFAAHSDENRAVAMKVAHEGIILLKNKDNILPVTEKVKKIAIVGPRAKNTPSTGFGAGMVTVPEDAKVDFYTGIKAAAGEGVDVRKVGASSKFAREADVVFVCVGFSGWLEMESMDRDWEMPSSHVRTIKRAAKNNPNTVVLITAGGGVETESWINDVAGVVHTFYLGEPRGTAIADIIYGDVNPSGKLPYTMVKRYEDLPASEYYLPEGKKLFRFPRLALNGSKVLRKIWHVEYKEGIYLGYRHHDTFNVAPQFEFGFGLSYTTFDIKNAKLSATEISGDQSITVTVDVTNTGDRAGSEVVQLYVADKESSLDRPAQELKNFEKVFLEPGETKSVTMTISKDALSYFDPAVDSWVAESGEFEIRLGNSSRNISQTLTFNYKK
ncbi:MAG: glycoside hydrolase family 3 C-terminal domain-containing protein [Spirochaetales bacterium]|nr:glycoside hydrolase family 3 C-terminal domain-containing protein [Spirochaetales bacterium]